MILQRQVAVRHVVGSSAERRHNARVAAGVMLWRMFAVALLSVPVAICVNIDSLTPHCDHITPQIVKAYAFEAFPQWAMANQSRACPESIDELSEYTSQSLWDPWERKLEMRCVPGTRLYVRSAGPDRRFDTADDITSND